MSAGLNRSMVIEITQLCNVMWLSLFQAAAAAATPVRLAISSVLI